MDRAYSTIEIKAVSDAKRTFTGIASTPSTDRMGDVVEPKGAVFKLPIPLLWQHDSKDPIGWITAAKITDKGIEVTGEVATITADPADPSAAALAQRLSTAWQYMKNKLVRGLSIGFNSIESARIDGTYGLKFIKWEWLELSAVTIPANQDATITAIKNIDTTQRAASGQSQRGVGTAPGASGPTHGANDRARNTRGTTMKGINELKELRAQKFARQQELVTAFKDANHTTTDEEKAEFDTLAGEIETLDQDIRIKGFEASVARGASHIDGNSSAAGAASRGPTGFVKKEDPEDKFQGQSFTRLIIARAAAFAALKDGNPVSAADIAQARWGKTHPKLVQYIRTAVAGGGTGSGEWGAELAQSDTRYNGDFVNFLYSMTVFDRLPLREIPARVHVKGQDGAATGYWVGESKAIPVSKPDFSDVELLPLKVGAIATLSKELVMDSQPSAEMLVRDSLAQASAQRVDTTFLSAAAASAGVSPAGLLNGLSAFAPSGTDEAAVRADFQSLVQPFIQAHNAGGLVHVMTPSLALAISLLTNALGQYMFPGVLETGGTLLGRPVFTGDNVTAGDWIVLKPSDIWKIGDSGVQIAMTDTATIEQNDAPQGAGDTPTAASATLINLWQEDMIGFKVTRRINYAKRRTGCVQVLSNAEYGGVIS